MINPPGGVLTCFLNKVRNLLAIFHHNEALLNKVFVLIKLHLFTGNTFQ
jgi:hypothetical protein